MAAALQKRQTVNCLLVCVASSYKCLEHVQQKGVKFVRFPICFTFKSILSKNPSLHIVWFCILLKFPAFTYSCVFYRHGQLLNRIKVELFRGLYIDFFDIAKWIQYKDGHKWNIQFGIDKLVKAKPYRRITQGFTDRFMDLKKEAVEEYVFHWAQICVSCCLCRIQYTFRNLIVVREKLQGHVANAKVQEQHFRAWKLKTSQSKHKYAQAVVCVFPLCKMNRLNMWNNKGKIW